MVLITQISIPKTQDREAFEKFMREEFIPSVYLSPTRLGQTYEVSLLSKKSKSRMFVYHYLHNGDSTKPDLGSVSMEITEKLSAFKTTFKRIGTFEVIKSRNHLQKDELTNA